MSSPLKTCLFSASERLLLEAHPLPLWIVDAECFAIAFANPAASRLYGYSVPLMERSNFLDFFSEYHRFTFIERLSGEIDECGIFSDSFCHHNNMGEQMAVDLHLSTIHLNNKKYYQVTAIDQTDKIHFGELIKEENNRYKTFIEQSVAGIFCKELHIPIEITASARDMVAHLDQHSYISECNAAMEAMWVRDMGTEDKSFSLSGLLKMDADGTENFIQRFIDNDFKLQNAELHDKDAQGNTRYYLTNLIGIVQNGNLIRIWGSQRDVTLRRQIEENNSLLAHLVEETSDILVAADMEYRPLTWNKAAEKISGIPATQILGRQLKEFIQLEYKSGTYDEVREIIKQNGEWTGEASFTRPCDQKKITLIITYKQLRCDDKALGILVTATDITERINAESRIRESEARFNEMADAAPVMIWMTDENNKITYLNEKWLDFTGKDITAYNSEGWRSLVHPDDLVPALNKYLAAFDNRKPVVMVYRLLNHKGEYRWIQDTGIPRFLSENNFVGFIGSVVDIEEQKLTEEQLRYQATVLENVSDIIITTDNNFIIKAWNKAAEDHYGIVEKTALGTKIKATIPALFQHESFEVFNEELVKFGSWTGEISIDHPNGTTRYFHFTVKKIYHDLNKLGYVYVGRDITERKEIENKLQKSEQFYRTLISDSLDGIILLDGNGNINFSSPSVKNVLGFETEELVGLNGFSFVHPDDIAWAMESFQREVSDNPEIKYIVVRLRKKSGDWLWCMVRGHNLLSNPYINSIVIYFHDDTMRKQAADALKESEKRFRALIKDLQIGVILQDAEGKTILCNKAMTDIFEVEEQELIGKPIWKIYTDVVFEDGKNIPLSERPTYKAMQSGKQVKDVVMGVWHPNKKERCWLLISTEPILNENGEVLHILCSVANITERKKQEKKLLADGMRHQKQLTQATLDGQEKERREIGKELHDNIGQQLTTIKLFLDLAKSTANETTLEMVNMALKGVGDAINEIRAMSRALLPHTLSDLGLVESICELTDSLSRAQLIRIDFNYEDFEEINIPENQKLTLFRIVQEQLNNIAKHAEATNISVTLRSTIQSVLLEIIDDGKGFDKNTVKKGLGFTNIRNRAELFGGKKEIVSSPGEGCYLKVSMPVVFTPASTLHNSIN
jgi:PAS domain S-box-containing protein